MCTSSVEPRPFAKTYNCPEDLLEKLGKDKPQSKTYCGTSGNISVTRKKEKQKFKTKFSPGMTIKKNNNTTENCSIEDGLIDCKITMSKIVSLLGLENKQNLTEYSERSRKYLDSLNHKQAIEDAIERIEHQKHDILDKNSYAPLHQDIQLQLSTMRSHKLKHKNDHIPREILGDLLRIREIPQVTSNVLILSEELQRFATFSKYPGNVNISLLRLAQAGFFYQGKEKETICYSCGVTYSNWTSGDNPMEVHRRISPRCDLVTKNENLSAVEDNGPKNNVVSDNTRESRLHKNDRNCQSNVTNTTTELSDNTSQNEIQQNSSNHSNVNFQQGAPSGHSRSPVAGATNNVTSNCSERSTNSESTIASSASNETELYPDYSSLGIYTAKPRYPNYSPLQVRISSYQGWPAYLEQTPQEMAKAGFLFAGYNDYARCFFCGGGLRNWEAGDDPWIEHARWFPECEFLKQNKGEAYIATVLRKHKELEAAQSRNQQTLPQQNQQQTNASNSPAVNNDHETSTNQDDPLNSAAARAVLEMGYSNEQVIDAIQNIKPSQKGEKIISATDILNVLLPQSSQGATSDVQADDKQQLDTTLTDLSKLQIHDTGLLLEENRQLRDQKLCKVCLDMDATIAFLPCGHIVCCCDCAPAMRKCPICRKYVKGTVKTYLA